MTHMKLTHVLGSMAVFVLLVAAGCSKNTPQENAQVQPQPSNSTTTESQSLAVNQNRPGIYDFSGEGVDDCYYFENAEYSGDDLLTILAAGDIGNGGNSRKDPVYYTPQNAGRLKAIVDRELAKENKQFRAISVCHLKDGLDVASGVLWDAGLSWEAPNYKTEAAAYNKFLKEIQTSYRLLVVNGDKLSMVKDVPIHGPTVTGGDVASCRAALVEPDITWSCFTGAVMDDKGENFIGDNYRVWTVSPEGKILKVKDIYEELAVKSTEQSDIIKVTVPESGSTVSSPLHIEGQARGSWYFEASFPVKLLDANGKQLASAPAQAQGEWMTNDFVPFKIDLTFETPITETGTLVLEKDNPSGLPQNTDEIRIPVKFDLKARTVELYYYNQSRDLDAAGNVSCTDKGLVAVRRQIPSTVAPIKDTINLLLQGRLSDTEKSQGISTEYPLPGLALKSAALSNGTLTLEFNDPQNKTSGGSCRVGILWRQISATAKQFPEVKTVKFKPDTLFQP